MKFLSLSKMNRVTILYYITDRNVVSLSWLCICLLFILGNATIHKASVEASSSSSRNIHTSVRLSNNNHYFFDNKSTSRRIRTTKSFSIAFGIPGVGKNASKKPTSIKEREQQAIKSIQYALDNPRVPSYRLIECEFPILQSLNKLNDGSIRSSNDAEDANIYFCMNLINTILSPFQKLGIGSGPKVWYLLSSTCTNNLLQKVKNIFPKNYNKNIIDIYTLKDGIPSSIKSKDIFILMTPCISNDYQAAKQLVMNGNSVIMINGLAKDLRSVSSDATMAYYYKPLTYNSDIGGYLIRSYPQLWTIINAKTNEVLGTNTDDKILVPNTNTPDLRVSVKLVQKSVDEQAIKDRMKTK